jgi:hypothetical protein
MAASVGALPMSASSVGPNVATRSSTRINWLVNTQVDEPRYVAPLKKPFGHMRLQDLELQHI